LIIVYKMDTPSVPASPKLDIGTSGITINKNILIALLVFLLIFSLLGINILHVFGNLFQILGNFFQSIVNIFKPLIVQILSLFGYTAGSVINTTADVVSVTAKTGIDIATGTVHSVGNLLKDGSAGAIDNNSKRQFDNALNLSNIKGSLPDADNANSNIQTSIVSGKTQWCLAGDYQGKRGCVEIDKDTQCMSGQIFPSQHQCLNPNLTHNMP
jgi:hypothetical protein